MLYNHPVSFACSFLSRPFPHRSLRNCVPTRFGTCCAGLTWYGAYPYSPRTFAGATAFCKGKGGRLATFSEYCPSNAVLGGMKSGDQWAPFSGASGDNEWVQVGTGHVPCQKHTQVHGKPTWGPTGSQPFQTYVLCAEEAAGGESCAHPCPRAGPSC